jgi:hypothetical protein
MSSLHSGWSAHSALLSQNTAEGRLRKKELERIAVTAEAANKAEEVAREEAVRRADPIAYVNGLHRTRRLLLEQLQQKEQEGKGKHSRRGTAKRRMNLIASVSTDDDRGKFGDDEGDWQMYLGIHAQDGSEEVQEVHTRVVRVDVSCAWAYLCRRHWYELGIKSRTCLLRYGRIWLQSRISC